MVREALAKVVFSLVLLAAPAVSAAEGEATENAAAEDEGAWVPKAQGNRLGGELDWWPDTGKDTFTWGIVGQIRVARAVHIDFEVPMGYRDVGANKNFIFGNPMVGAHWADSVSSRVGFFAGVALAVSTFIGNESSNPFDNGVVEQYRPRSAAFESRAYADGQRFLPDSLFLRARFGLEVRIIPELFYRAEIAPMGVSPLGHVRAPPRRLRALRHDGRDQYPPRERRRDRGPHLVAHDPHRGRRQMVTLAPDRGDEPVR